MKLWGYMQQISYRQFLYSGNKFFKTVRKRTTEIIANKNIDDDDDDNDNKIKIRTPRNLSSINWKGAFLVKIL
jgi:hypothetical protein